MNFLKKVCFGLRETKNNQENIHMIKIQMRWERNNSF